MRAWCIFVNQVGGHLSGMCLSRNTLLSLGVDLMPTNLYMAYDETTAVLQVYWSIVQHTPAGDVYTGLGGSWPAGMRHVLSGTMLPVSMVLQHVISYKDNRSVGLI